MKKFGFGKKKDKDGDRSSNNSSPGPSSNPYAQPQAAADPYAQDNNKYAGMGGHFGPQSAYQKAKMQTYAPPGPAPGPQRGGYGAPPPAYDDEGNGTSASSSTYGNEKYGSGGGYGSNRYDSGSGYTAPSRGPGGYGGLGRADSSSTTTTDANRDALFGDARERHAKQQTPLPPANGQPGGGYEADSQTSGYGGYGEQRELTAEEQEEEEVNGLKQQIRFMKQEDVSSTRNALRIAAQAEEQGRATLARLGAQGERIHNTEKNLDLAANHNRIAEEKAKELKTLNGSMFAMHVSNPFTKNARRQQRDEDILNKHREEREQHDVTRHAAFGTQMRMEGAFRELQPGDPGYRIKPPTKASLAERSKYQFEADSEDEEMENEIDSNLDALSGAAGRLNLLARATGAEVDEQNKHIDRIIQKSDKVDDQIAMSMFYMPLTDMDLANMFQTAHVWTASTEQVHPFGCVSFNALLFSAELEDWRHEILNG
jgi:hypothetical protein